MMTDVAKPGVKHKTSSSCLFPTGRGAWLYVSHSRTPIFSRMFFLTDSEKNPNVKDTKLKSKSRMSEPAASHSASADADDSDIS